MVPYIPVTGAANYAVGMSEMQSLACYENGCSFVYYILSAVS
jgi:hypothetical protein